VRNLGLSIALWLAAILPTSSLALGLGEIEVNSFLNQPLNAEIEVLSARPGEIDDLLVSLASREAFTRAGLARPRHLSDLKFAVNKSEDGNSAVIAVTTRSAVKEPFLNFLVEADWSKGRLLREFTVLLDPPFYADQPPPAESISEGSMPEAGDDAGAMVEPPDAGSSMSMPPAESDSSITEPIALSAATAGTGTSEPAYSPPASSEYVADSSTNIIQGDVLVVKGDTLWSIASRYKDDSHSMAQVMLAFQRSNPNAFGNGNINNLKVGAVLRAPSASEIDALGQQAAYAEVLTQNGLWDEYVARVSGVSPAMGSSDGGTRGTGEAEAASGELSLLMPGEGDSDSTGTGDAADLDQLRTKLALAEEELEASRIENKDLESRISELQARVSKFEELQKMVEIEDDSLAQIQAGQGAKATVAETETTLGTDTISETIAADEQALLEELLAEEAAAQAEEQIARQQGDMPDGESETSLTDQMTDDAVPAAGSGADQITDDEVLPAPAITPPAPVIITESAAASPSMLDGILPSGVADMIPSMDFLLDPIVLAAVGGVILLLLVLVVVKRRKAAQDDAAGFGANGDDDLFASDDEEELTPIHLTEAEDQVQTDIKVPTSEDMDEQEKPAVAVAEDDDEFAATAIVSAVDMPEAEEPAAAAAVPEQDDVLNEVDVYLAYGLYDNAEDLLNTSLAEHPDRGDYRSKLLDTYFATKNADAFVKEAENLKAMGDAANPYWARVQVMGYELAPDNALFSDAKDSGLSAADLEIAKPQEADFDLGGGDEDDTNFSSTDFNLGEEDTGSSFDETDFSGEAGDLESTQQLASAAGSTGTAGDVDDDLLDLPDDIGGELEFSMDDEGGDDLKLPADDLALPDDFDIDADEPALEIDSGELNIDDELDDLAVDSEAPGAQNEGDLALDFDMDDDDDEALDLGDALDLDDDVEAVDSKQDDIADAPTAVITPNFEETAVLEMDEADEGDDSEIDLGMEDTALRDAGEPVDDDDDLQLDTGEDDDDEDISIIDFGGEDFVEPTELVQPVSAIDDSDDDFVLDDDDAEEVRTGTFAPGDFDEPTAAVESLAGMDDMDDLMLPDDVDEVSTKLDLARAFIDMGDTEGARGSLEEVMSEGNAEQKEEAKGLLDQIK